MRKKVEGLLASPLRKDVPKCVCVNLRKYVSHFIFYICIHVFIVNICHAVAYVILFNTAMINRRSMLTCYITTLFSTTTSSS